MNAISAPNIQSAPTVAPKVPASVQRPDTAPVPRPTVAPAQVASAANTSAPKEQALPGVQQAREMAAQMQRKMATVAPDLEFAVDKESGKALIKVIDRSTQKVVWQIPSEEMLRVTQALDRFQEGMMLRRTA